MLAIQQDESHVGPYLAALRFVDDRGRCEALGRKAFIPNVASLGFGLFFATYATSAWGGAFPMLPTDFQTYNVLVTFFLMESLAFCGMFFVGMLLSFTHPSLLRHRSSVLGSPLMTLGSLCLIAPLYFEALTMVFVVSGGILFGLGSSLFFLSWQRLFASRTNDTGTVELVVGMGLSAPFYGLMHLIPSAVAAFSIPLVLIPLSEVCLIEASRSMDFDQPMFTDSPSQNRAVYRGVLDRSLKSALCVGAFGFASGITRAIALTNPAMGSLVNAIAMVGLFIATVLLLWLWQRRSFTFDTRRVFWMIAPFAATAFLLMPYLNDTYLYVFSGIMYMVFSFAVMVMMVQCMQVSRNDGVSPTFVYGFFGGIVYALQACGFLFGYSTEALVLHASPQLATFALVSTWVFMIAAQITHRKPALLKPGAPDIELLTLAPPTNSAEDIDGSVLHAGSSEARALRESMRPKGKGRGVPLSAPDNSHENADDIPGLKDRISKQCLVLTKRYLLTTREAEVMELLVRGNTASDIASKLTISENTAKTHVKRLYAKLDVHKRRELLALFEELD